MKIETYIDSLVSYAMNTGLADPLDHQVLTNRLLDILRKDDYEPSNETQSEDLEEILAGILDYAVAKGICDDGITAKDIFDTRIMGAITPMPREVIDTFWEKYAFSPVEATDWYYKFSCDTDYIRRYRIKKDMRWKYKSEYGELDITINLSKPEKDPKAIAAAKNAPQSAYPKCQLCVENEGYAGRMNHPARANHRIVPIAVCDQPWCLQYSPYVYYNEHCIVFNSKHIPMKIDKSAFEKLLDFVKTFPHYFVGSNADLPIVGGSILSHDHFQGGHYVFPMEMSPVEEEFQVSGFEDVQCGIVRWPMSVLRLACEDDQRLVELADHILLNWRGYTDEAAFIFAETDGVPHNTITPIARFRDGKYELDLVLRNNITTEEHPMGVYHPHDHLHHIKKENIGLIEVMGLAVLPARLKEELAVLADQIGSLSGDALVEAMKADPRTEKHADWVVEFLPKYDEVNADNAMEIVQNEVGIVFSEVLECAGVYKRTEEGREALRRFLAQL